MGVVSALLAAEVRGAVPPAASATVAAFAPRPEALHRRKGFDRRAVDTEVLVREQTLDGETGALPVSSWLAQVLIRPDNPLETEISDCWYRSGFSDARAGRTICGSGPRLAHALASLAVF
jgi:hypothetical protein